MSIMVETTWKKTFGKLALHPSPIRLKTYTGEYGKPSVSKIISDVNSRCTSELECTSEKSEKSGQSILNTWHLQRAVFLRYFFWQ